MSLYHGLTATRGRPADLRADPEDITAQRTRELDVSIELIYIYIKSLNSGL